MCNVALKMQRLYHKFNGRSFDRPGIKLFPLAAASDKYDVDRKSKTEASNLPQEDTHPLVNVSHCALGCEV